MWACGAPLSVPQMSRRLSRVGGWVEGGHLVASAVLVRRLTPALEEVKGKRMALARARKELLWAAGRASARELAGLCAGRRGMCAARAGCCCSSRATLWRWRTFVSSGRTLFDSPRSPSETIVVVAPAERSSARIFIKCPRATK